jgi:ACS family glucarate transporter-like MFS transporter
MAIFWWSAFTVLMSLIPYLHFSSWMHLAWAFAIVRFLTGAGEAASYPNANKIVAFWTTSTERGIGSSMLLGGVGAGGILAPILFAATMHKWGWRSSFVVSGILAVLVGIVWFLYSTNRPKEHPRVSPEELELLSSTQRIQSHSFQLKGTPWRKFFSSRSVWALIASYFCHGYTPFIFFTWFFVYLTRVRGLSVKQGGWWGATPFIAMTIMALLGGWLSDKAVARFGRRRGRQSMAGAGMTCSALLLWAGSHAQNNTYAILMLALAAGFSNFAAPSWWATCIDLTPNYSGSLSGLMNTCANTAGGIAPILTAYIATTFGWSKALDFAALVSFTSGVIWIFVNADENLESATTSLQSGAHQTGVIAAKATY